MDSNGILNRECTYKLLPNKNHNNTQNIQQLSTLFIFGDFYYLEKSEFLERGFY